MLYAKNKSSGGEILFLAFNWRQISCLLPVSTYEKKVTDKKFREN